MEKHADPGSARRPRHLSSLLNRTTMWFRNLQLYRLPAPWNISLEKLDEQLQRGAFQRCPSHEAQSRGWVAPRADGALVYAQNQQWMIALCTEQRLLPSAVVNETVKERAELMAVANGYPPGRKQLRELRELVTAELLPRAFTRRRTTSIWIDAVGGWLAIDAASPAKAEEVLEHLRWTLDEFPLKPVHTERSPVAAMTDWLAAGEAPAGFSIDRDCELKSVSEEKAAVRYVRHPLEGDEIKAHIVAGKLPTKLALTWSDRISFVLSEKLEVKRLAFLDLLKEEAEKNAEHADEQFDADFALMSGELARLIPDLMAALGGEVKEE